MHFEDRTTLASPTGATLSLRHQPAAGGAKAIVQICHGLSEHSGRYGAFAAFLAARGYHVYAHDHRGHGHSTAPDAEPGRFAWRDGQRRIVEDVLTVGALARERHSGLPVILFGHSFGGSVALATAEAQPGIFAGLAVWNANLNLGLDKRIGFVTLRIERFFKGSDVPSPFSMQMTFGAWAKAMPDARTAFDWVSRDPGAVDSYIADPFCGYPPSVSAWLDSLTLVERAGRRRELAHLPKTLPVHLVGGDRDPVTDNGTAIRWLARRMRSLGMTAVDLTIYESMRHETLNEIGREDAMKAFAAWADGVVMKVSQMDANG